MMNSYFNQTVTLKSKSTTNEYNESTYISSTIKARVEYNRKIVRDAVGKEVFSTSTVYCINPVNPDDLMIYGSRDWVVLSVNSYVGLFGDIVCYEVNLI